MYWMEVERKELPLHEMVTAVEFTAVNTTPVGLPVGTMVSGVLAEVGMLTLKQKADFGYWCIRHAYRSYNIHARYCV